MSMSKQQLVKNPGEINRIHDEIIENSVALLQRAMECGTILLSVKNEMDHGEWEKWLAANCPQIEDRTARAYMRLAKNSEQLEKLAAENGSSVADLSIRGALRLLTKAKTEEQKAKAKSDREAKAKAKADEAKLAAMAGANLADVMKAKSADEIKTALKQSAAVG
jgi:hypothetical protein